jgi:hypothetical protein
MYIVQFNFPAILEKMLICNCIFDIFVPDIPAVMTMDGSSFPFFFPGGKSNPEKPEVRRSV